MQLINQLSTERIYQCLIADCFRSQSPNRMLFVTWFSLMHKRNQPHIGITFVCYFLFIWHFVSDPVSVSKKCFLILKHSLISCCSKVVASLVLIFSFSWGKIGSQTSVTCIFPFLTTANFVLTFRRPNHILFLALQCNSQPLHHPVNSDLGCHFRRL